MREIMGSMTDAPPLHPSLEPLAFLVGTWRGRGHGDYPTIEAFEYLEEVAYSHVGKPFLAYTQRTRDAATGGPLHTETGYVRPVDGRSAEMVLTQPSGILEMHEIAIEGTSLTMATIGVMRTPTSKPVAAVERHIHVDGDSMSYRLDMAAMDLEMQFHLAAELQRDPGR
jgi:hypothetical protein